MPFLWWRCKAKNRTAFSLLQSHSGVSPRGKIESNIKFCRTIGIVIDIHAVHQHIYDVSTELGVVDVSLGELGEPINNHLSVKFDDHGFFFEESLFSGPLFFFQLFGGVIKSKDPRKPQPPRI